MKSVGTPSPHASDDNSDNYNDNTPNSIPTSHIKRSTMPPRIINSNTNETMMAQMGSIAAMQAASRKSVANPTNPNNVKKSNLPSNFYHRKTSSLDATKSIINNNKNKNSLMQTSGINSNSSDENEYNFNNNNPLPPPKIPN